MMRSSIVSLAVAGLFFCASAQAALVNSSLTLAFSPLMGPPITSNFNLDSVDTDGVLKSWAVWQTTTGAANFKVGTSGNFGAIGSTSSTFQNNNGSWAMTYTGAQNGAPASGSGFGYNVDYTFGGGTGTMTLSITPNIQLGTSGRIKVFGDLNLGLPFFVQADGTATMTMSGVQAQAFTINSGVAGNPPGTQAQQATWIYSVDFTNYAGETFAFLMSNTFGTAGDPESSIAAVQIQKIPEPGTLALLPLIGVAGLLVRRKRRK